MSDETDDLRAQLRTLSEKLRCNRVLTSELIAKYEKQGSRVERLLSELQSVAQELHRRHLRLSALTYILPCALCCDEPSYRSCEGCHGSDACADEPCAKCLGCEK